MATVAGRVLCVVLVSMAWVCLLVPTWAAATGHGNVPGSSDSPLYVVLDVSGSMGDGDPRAKLDVAKESLLALIQDLPPEQEVTLVTYPSGAKRIENCNAGSVRAGPSVGDRSALAAAIRSMRPDGGTPTGPALMHVMEMFKNSGHQVGDVVLISDGEANCGETDVCEVAQQMSGIGLDLRVNTVRLDISAAGAEQLQCIADATGGVSVGADDASRLAESIKAASRGVLTLSVTAPEVLQTITGSTRTQAATNVVTVTVRATGAHSSEDVRLHLQLRDAHGRTITHQVREPARYLGNLARGTNQTLTFSVRPISGVAGPLSYDVFTLSRNSALVSSSGTMRVIDSADRSSSGSIFTDAHHAVIMGDSYSSGEGAGDYDGADDYTSQVFRCHRSPHTYGRSLFDSMPDPPGATRRVTQLACSGATTTDMPRYQYIPTIRPQLTELRSLADSAEPPDLVLLTLGGNDVGFGDFIQACFWGGRVLDGDLNFAEYRPCGRDNDDDLTGTRSFTSPWTVSGTLTNRTKTKLTMVYRDIDYILNRPEVVQRRDGRVAQVVVLPYVNPLGPYHAARGGCFVGLNEIEFVYAQQFLDTLNATVAAAVAEANAVKSSVQFGTPVHIASPVVDAFQFGRTICDPDPAVRIDGPVSKGISEALPGDDGFGRIQELMHPTRDGYALIASSLVEWSRTVPVHWVSTYRAPPREVKVEAPFTATYRRVIGALDPPRLPENYATMPLACDDLFTTPQCETITATKYGLVSLFSTQTPIGFIATTDPDRMFEELRWPADIAPGRHTLTFDGVTDDGQPVHIEAPLTIHPPGTTAGLTMMALGLLSTTGGTLWWSRLRRRT